MVDVSERDRFRLVLDVAQAVDSQELDEITTQLRDRVCEVFEVHAVERIPVRSHEPGGKAGEVFLPGQLDILVPLAAVALHQVFSTIRTYLRERPMVKVTIRRDRKGNLRDLEITGTTQDVDALVRRCLEEPGGPE